MAPFIDVADGDFERAKKLLKFGNINYSIPKNKDSGRIYVPSLDLFVERGTTPALGNISLFEFTRFLLYARDNVPEVYQQIVESRIPPRVEYTDTFFRKRKDGIYVFTKKGTHVEKLDEDTLVEERKISLDSWLENPTSQGLPRKEIEEGNLYYWPPKGGAGAAFSSNFGDINLACHGRRDMGSVYAKVRMAEPSDQIYFNFSQ